jgi:hypothetical protein
VEVVVDAEAGVGLAAMIQSLRSELQEAVAAGDTSDLQFGLGPIELELEVAVGREQGGEGGIKFWVVTLGGKASKTFDRTQRIKLTLTPRKRGHPEDDVYVDRLDELGD